MLLWLLACMPQLHGAVDSGEGPCTLYLDADLDGYGGECAPLTASTVVTNNDDCDDSDPGIHPGADEICDGLDQDCDGAIDDDAIDVIERWSDRDGDGFGKPTSPALVCADAPDYADNNRDCDDNNPAVNPDGEEVCGDELDNDCNGNVDEAGAVDAELWFHDDDGDGVGAEPYGNACIPPGSLYSTEKDDCDDNDPDVFPGQTAFFERESESKGWDYNCDGRADMEYPDPPECDSSSSCTILYSGFAYGYIPDCGWDGSLALSCSDPTGFWCDVSTNWATQRCH